MANLAQETKTKNRDIRFDFLKTLGLLCIILAHSSPPHIISQLRNFDVPLMVIVSGTLFSYSFRDKKYSFWEYIKKRIIRLVSPVWLFLLFFFSSIYILDSLTDISYPFTLKSILTSFLLLGGIGYVWIIRVFVLMAIISPLILGLHKYFASDVRFLAALSGIYVFYELIFNFIQHFSITSPLLATLVNSYLLLLIPYGCMLGLGMVLTRMNRQSILAASAIFLIIFLTLTLYHFCVSGKFVATQSYKDPPTLYYLSYAIFVSMLAYYVVDKFLGNYFTLLSERESFLIKWISFVSSSSLWIYLWHIYCLHYWLIIAQHLSPIATNFTVIFTVVTFTSIAITYLQKKLISGVITETRFGREHCELMATLFLK